MKIEEQRPSNPPAFACIDNMSFHQPGMTLRDYFAANAMQGMISLLSPSDMNDANYVWVSEISYKQADAMLKQREL